MNKYIHTIILIILIGSSSVKPQNGAYIAPVIKFTSINGQGANILGVKWGWVINKTFIIGAAYYALNSDVSQNWVDPANGSPSIIKFTTGGLNFEYLFLSGNVFSASAEMFLGGAGINLRPKDSNQLFTVMYGGDFLVWEPQLNANLNLNDWFHLSLGASYRTTSALDIYTNNDPAGPHFPMKDLRGFASSISLIFGMY